MLGRKFVRNRLFLEFLLPLEVSKAYAERVQSKGLVFRSVCRADGGASGRIWPGQRPANIIELDNLLHGLLECPPHCDSWVREEGANPSRSRRCKMGTKPVEATVFGTLTVTREPLIARIDLLD